MCNTKKRIVGSKRCRSFSKRTCHPSMMIAREGCRSKCYNVFLIQITLPLKSKLSCDVAHYLNHDVPLKATRLSLEKNSQYMMMITSKRRRSNALWKKISTIVTWLMWASAAHGMNESLSLHQQTLEFPTSFKSIPSSLCRDIWVVKVTNDSLLYIFLIYLFRFFFIVVFTISL